MKAKVLSLVSVLLVFLCIIGCTGRQDIGAGITEAVESAVPDLSDSSDTDTVTKTETFASEFKTTSDDSTSVNLVSYVTTTKTSTTVKAKTTALPSVTVTTQKQTTTARIITTTKPTVTTKTVTTTKSVTTTKATTTTKTTTTRASGGSVGIVDTTAATQAGGTVSLYISCKKAVDYGIREQPGYDVIIPEDGVLLSTTAELENGDTVMSLLARVLKDKSISLNKQSDYIRGIGGLNEKDCGPTSGWLYSVNGVFPSYSTANYILSNGDSVRILYSIVNGDVTLISN